MYIFWGIFFIINVWLFCVHCIIWDQAIKVVNLGINYGSGVDIFKC